jgi:hypothetical protein
MADKNTEIAEALKALNNFNSAARPFTRLADLIPGLEKAVALVGGAEAGVADAEKRKAALEKDTEALLKAHEALGKDHARLKQTYDAKVKDHEAGLAEIEKTASAFHRTELAGLEKQFIEQKDAIKERDLAYFAKLDAARDERTAKHEAEAKALADDLAALGVRKFELTEEIRQLQVLRDQVQAALKRPAA